MAAFIPEGGGHLMGAPRALCRHGASVCRLLPEFIHFNLPVTIFVQHLMSTNIEAT